VSAPVRWTGRLSGLAPDELRSLLSRAQTDAGEQERCVQVASILAEVRARGDAALRDLARRFDRVSLESLEVPRAAVRAALDRQPPSLRRAMERSARNVARVHSAFRPQPARVEAEPGVVVERRPDPLARVGVYAPGGRAAYPSSVLMGAIPARVAGVREVVLCSPAGLDGKPSDPVLAAAAVAEVDRVFALGGAGAIAALAYGTESVPVVDRIVGPGNAWVAEAKCQVASRVPIDAPAGPSELLVLLDSTSDVEAIARELLAQAEHDPEATVVAVALDDATARQLLDRLETLAPDAARADVIRPALASRGAVLVAGSLDEATAFAERWAPEHLMLAVDGAPERAELFWRISVPISAFLLLLLAVPMSYVNPRMGRSFNLIAALFMYMLYSNCLNIVQSFIAQGRLSLLAGLVMIHSAAAAVVLALLYRRLSVLGWFPWRRSA